jgi:23S rRNA (uracil1939-C5)-methyltransferase
MTKSQQKFTPEVTQYNVSIGRLTYGGGFEGKVQGGDVDRSYPVPRVIRGETARIEVKKMRRRRTDVSLLEVLTSADDRIEAPCRFFGTCGGCNLQHMTLPAQREEKRRMIDEVLREAGLEIPEAGVVLLGAELRGFAYRKRAVFHVNFEGQFGYFMPGSYRMIEIDRCLIVTEKINNFFLALKPMAVRAARRILDIFVEEHGEQIFVLVKLRHWRKNKDAVVEIDDLVADLKDLVPNFKIIKGSNLLYHQHDFQKIDIHAGTVPTGHFSQVNEDANRVLLETISRHVTSQDVTDLYAGAGNLSFPLAAAGKNVVAVEADRALAKYGEAIAAERGLSERMTFHRKACEKWVQKNPLTTSTVLLDPPRSGAREVAEAVNPAVNETVIYVSCHLPTLARDLSIMTQKGYRISHIYFLDMFPQTHHVETLTVLRAVDK